MNYLLPNKKLTITIEDSILNELKNHSETGFPNETGGLLIGEYLNDNRHLAITNTILPKRINASPISFERNLEGLQNEIINFFNIEGKYYVGEWHSHPNGNANYSVTDLNAMINIEQCKTVHINNPVLLIIGVTLKKFKELKFYYFDKGELYEYQKQQEN